MQLIKNFQSSVFEAFLHGKTLEECYASVAKVADYWLDVLYSKGANMPDVELFELISENRSMSRKLEDYGNQKSTSISTARRLAEFLGDQMVKDAGLACRYVISKKPEGAPVTERAIPLAIFQAQINVRRHYLRKWLKDNTIGDSDIREILDWSYYIERLGGAIQKIITIPAALQGLMNPVPRIRHPEWLHKKIAEKDDNLKQKKINEIFSTKLVTTDSITSDTHTVLDIEDIHEQDRSAIFQKPSVIKRKRNVEEEILAQKPWREVFGFPPKIGMTRSQILEWLTFQRNKWDHQQLHKKLQVKKQIRHISTTINSNNSYQRLNYSTLTSFMKNTQRVLLECPWHILQAYQVDQSGIFLIWAMIGTELHRVKINVPRIFYVNQRTPTIRDENTLFKKSFKLLPRSQTVYHLYQYSISEISFKDNQLDLLIDLATPSIEGIYETQISLEFRLLMELGCICQLQKSETKRLIETAKEVDTFTLTQLETIEDTEFEYLDQIHSLKRIFFYQHSTQSNKRSIWSVFAEATKKAIVIVQDTVRTNQLVNLKNMYISEKMLYSKTNDLKEIPQPENFIFKNYQCIDINEVTRLISKFITQYQQEKKGPTIICMQTLENSSIIVQQIPILSEFPQVSIHIVDDASILSGLEWQKTSFRNIIRHYINLNAVLSSMLQQCRYFRLPLGNMPKDTMLFGSDLCYSRLLQVSYLKQLINYCKILKKLRCL